MKASYFFVLSIILIVIGLGFARKHADNTPQVSVYDDFASCLADAGAVFYGAWWCPHCNNQKEAFDNSKNLPYVECSTSDGQGQTQQCIDEQITGYPTWKFGDGSVLNGEVPLAELAAKTGCVLP
ncbi:hypothetical protein KC727_02565 [Candidatus Kaiserbacteria bacterium]|nr:hypothetical protein [Candidatus Kaiserbacteria bacterium]